MDYELASRELVRALRGQRSQAAVRRRLKRTKQRASRLGDRRALPERD